MNTYNVSQAASFAQSVSVYVFIALCIGIAITTFVLLYHWKKYSLNDPIVPFTQLIYFLGLCLLGGGALISIIV